MAASDFILERLDSLGQVRIDSQGQVRIYQETWARILERVSKGIGYTNKPFKISSFKLTTRKDNQVAPLNLPVD